MEADDGAFEFLRLVESLRMNGRYNKRYLFFDLSRQREGTRGYGLKLTQQKGYFQLLAITTYRATAAVQKELQYTPHVTYLPHLWLTHFVQTYNAYVA